MRIFDKSLTSCAEQVVARCRQVSDVRTARFAYVVADMADIDAYEYVVEVRNAYYMYMIVFFLQF